jgi:glycosyltransferase involved in cell wall biosynthesis
LVVVTDSIYPYHYGGKERRYQELLGHLVERGADVEIATMRWWTGAPARLPVRHRAICPLVPLYSNGRRRIDQAVLFALAMPVLLTGPRPALFEADHMPYLQLFPLRIVAWARRTPLVVTWHEVWGEEYWRTYLGRRRGSIAAVIERLAVRLPDHIVAVAQPTADRLTRLGVPPGRLTVIPAGVPAVEIAATSPDPDAPEILAIGRLLGHKRFDLVIEALAMLRANGANVRLGIVGEGPERGRLEARAAALGVGPQVCFYGRIEGDAGLWGLLRGAHVLAAPSEREGFGLIVAEALCAGTPVVTSDHPDNASRDLVGGGALGVLVQPGDAAALAAALGRFAHAEPERASIASTFRARHPELTWEGAASAYLELASRLAR